MSKTKFKTGYDDDKSADPTIDCVAAEKHGDLSRTVQSEKENCDINVIVARFEKTGLLTHTMDKVKATFGDFSNMPSFHEAQGVIAKSNQLFMEMPASIRNRFQNDPGIFLDFFADPENQPEAIKLGLATARTPAEPSSLVLPQEAPPNSSGGALKLETASKASKKASTED